MSTLKVNTVQHNTSGFNNVVQFTDGAGNQNGTLCRTWVRFNGSGTVSITDSFNVTSITDNGTGDYTVNYTTALSDGNYACACGSSSGVGGVTSMSIFHDTETTTSVRIFSVGAAYYDCDAISVAIFY